MNRHNMHPYNSGARPGQPQDPQTPHEEPEAPQAPDADLPAPEEQPDATVEKALPDAAEAARELDDMRLRMAAEMDNFKKRLTREHQEQMKYASEKVLADLLPALDNLDLALQYGSQHEACKDMMQGIEMTRRQLLEAVAKNGLLPVGQKGEAFNPEIHEAIGMQADPDLEKGAVSRVLQPGYKLNDRLLRPAKVMVNN